MQAESISSNRARLKEIEKLRLRRRNWENFRGLLFIGPNLLGFIVMVLLPVLFSLYLAFSEWNLLSGLEGIKFLGLKNFRDMITDEWFINSFKNTFIYTFTMVPLTLIVSLAIALVLNDKVFAKGFIRTMYFVPYIVNVVAVCSVWMALFSSFGPVNNFLSLLGFKDLPTWLMDGRTALPVIIFIGIWNNSGYCMVINLAALQGVPKELYEACEVDGGNGWSKLKNVTLPMITPTTFLLFVTQIISSFNVFAQIQIITKGGPGSSTSVMVYYIYKTAYQFYNMGYASAMAWVLVIIIFVITLFQWQGQKKWVN